MTSLPGNSIKYVAITTILVICTFAIYGGYRIYRIAEEAAVDSCIRSIESTLAEKLEREKGEINTSNQWKVLSKDEKEFLFDSVKDSKYFDCKRFQFYKTGKTRTGEDVQVSVRQVVRKWDKNIKQYQVKVECDGCFRSDNLY